MAKRTRATQRQAKKPGTEKKASAAGLGVVALLAVLKPLFTGIKAVIDIGFDGTDGFDRFAVGNPMIAGLAIGTVIAVAGWLVIRKLRPRNLHSQTSYAAKEDGYTTSAPTLTRADRTPIRRNLLGIGVLVIAVVGLVLGLVAALMLA
ncbi:hypothetical protein [Lacticaseibacillus absianus]|uniref:hypothetical protein n=1 Tax=Lacticaseibacillus absianus TaxID=2729623 RepID=UPI0015CE7B5C|nr:hypothetical protein [Lacticaseibacillus absianus]